MKTRRETYTIPHDLVRIKAVVVIPKSNHQSSENHLRLWITVPVPRKSMGSKFIHRFLSLHNHDTRILANIHANDSIYPPRDVLCNLHDGVVNMFICSCSENSESGIVIDVIVDHINSVNNGIVCVWGGWWPEGWVGGWVDCVVDCRRLVCHDSQLDSASRLYKRCGGCPNLECWERMAIIYTNFKTNRITS